MLTMIYEFRDRMTDIMDRAKPHLVIATPAGLEELDRCRSEMSRVLAIYNLFVHREIFEPLFTSGSLAEAAAAREMKVECICLVEEFRRHTSQWRFANVAGAWSEYTPRAIEFQLRIQRHLDRVIAIADPALSNCELSKAA